LLEKWKKVSWDGIDPQYLRPGLRVSNEERGEGEVRLNDGECRGCGGRLGIPPLFSLGDEDEDFGNCHTLASPVQQLIKLWAVR
jgi:hypothetical protein